jgi:hypothetical protein
VAETIPATEACSLAKFGFNSDSSATLKQYEELSCSWRGKARSWAKFWRVKNPCRMRPWRNKEDDGLNAFWRMDLASTTPDFGIMQLCEKASSDTWTQMRWGVKSLQVMLNRSSTQSWSWWRRKGDLDAGTADCK